MEQKELGALKTFVGLVIAVLPDIASGVLAGHILIKAMGNPIPLFSIGSISEVLGIGLNALVIYAIGAFCAIFPDLDALSGLLGKEDIADHKISGLGLHLPPVSGLVWIIPSAGTSWLSKTPFWLLLVYIPLLLHFLHDSTGSSEGIQWLWPFSENRYRFSLERGIYVYQGDFGGLEEWLRDDILKFAPEPIVGVAFAIAVAILVFVWETVSQRQGQPQKTRLSLWIERVFSL